MRFIIDVILEDIAQGGFSGYDMGKGIRFLMASIISLIFMVITIILKTFAIALSIFIRFEEL